MFAPTKVRTIRFAPYRRGMGPSFTLHLYDLHTNDSAGRYAVGFVLKMGRETIFSSLTAADAFYGHCAVDSDGAVEGVMSFLTLRPGDTDSDYFTNYTEAQRDFAASHAETLSGEVSARYCDENGNLKESCR